MALRPLVLLLFATALASPVAASGKGWMIVSAPSGGVEAGESWTATLTFPIATDPGAPPTPRHPELVFTHLANDVQRRFQAEPTSRRGVFRARVVLTTAGTWTVYVWAYEMGAVAPDPLSREIVVRPPARDSPASPVERWKRGGR